MEQTSEWMRVMKMVAEQPSLEEGLAILNPAIEEARRQGDGEAMEGMESLRRHWWRLQEEQRAREEFARTQPMPGQCLRCEGVELTVEPSADPEVNEKITFYACPSCGRHFARSPGRALCDRWGSLISFVLYDVLYGRDREEEQIHFQRIGHRYAQRKSRDEIARMIAEVELELKHPTQQVRNILDAPREEENAMKALRGVVDYWKKVLFIEPPARAFPCSGNPELDAANARTAALDIEPMRAHTAAAFGVDAGEVLAILEDDRGTALWRFSYVVDGKNYEWIPKVQTFEAYKDAPVGLGSVSLFLPEIAPEVYSLRLNWALIKRFVICMGYEIEGVSAHDRPEWMLDFQERLRKARPSLPHSDSRA